MCKLSRKCQTCGSKKACVIWTPLESLLLFADATNKQLTFETILICENCKSQIMLMMRSDGMCFEGCQTIQDLIDTVRKELKSWER
jgi:DNA-directed RNA polymerase subunit RPC12/RpoP